MGEPWMWMSPSTWAHVETKQPNGWGRSFPGQVCSAENTPNLLTSLHQLDDPNENDTCAHSKAKHPLCSRVHNVLLPWHPENDLDIQKSWLFTSPSKLWAIYSFMSENCQCIILVCINFLSSAMNTLAENIDMSPTRLLYTPENILKAFGSYGKMDINISMKLLREEKHSHWKSSSVIISDLSSLIQFIFSPLLDPPLPYPLCPLELILCPQNLDNSNSFLSALCGSSLGLL